MQKYKLILLLLSFVLMGCKDTDVQVLYSNDTAPQQFTAVFETTRGDFKIEVKKALSPHAANRLYNLIKNGYYNNAVFYRVVPGFVAQAGQTEPTKMAPWEAVKVPDEPVLYGNKKGSITFARTGRESRGLDLFINLDDNHYLDTLDFEGVRGFPAFGNVTEGMDVVMQLYSGYGETTLEHEEMLANPKRLAKAYPKLDVIKKAYLAED